MNIQKTRGIFDCPTICTKCEHLRECNTLLPLDIGASRVKR